MLALAAKGLSRERAYETVQKPAMACWRTGTPLKKLLWKEKTVRELLSKEEFEGLFDIGYYLKNVDYIFDRVFGGKGGKA
jgi:adenylosuccinate lyase